MADDVVIKQHIGSTQRAEESIAVRVIPGNGNGDVFAHVVMHDIHVDEVADVDMADVVVIDLLAVGHAGKPIVAGVRAVHNVVMELAACDGRVAVARVHEESRSIVGRTVRYPAMKVHMLDFVVGGKPINEVITLLASSPIEARHFNVVKGHIAGTIGCYIVS